jgi:fatty acid desaturase
MTVNQPDKSLHSRSTSGQSYINSKKPVWNAIAILYTFISYAGGIFLCTTFENSLNFLGAALLTHGLIFSAYLSHEFMHASIFNSRRWNVVFGTVMSWLNGSCYWTFQDLTIRHISHHVNRSDFSIYNLADRLQSKPRLIRQIVLVLEWLYFPILSFWIQWLALTDPWRHSERKNERSRVVVIGLARFLLFIALGTYSFQALCLYFLSYVGMITVLRWMDAFQHTYEVVPEGTKLPDRDRLYEEVNTFSNLLSRRYRLLNLLVLNAGYHNAHHAIMKCPWHSLPALDQDLYQGGEVHYISLWQQLVNYHKFRVTRVFSGQGEALNENGCFTPDKFYGAVGVSFLSLN